MELGQSWEELYLGAINLWRLKNQVFDPPPLYPHAFTWANPPSPLLSSTNGRHEIHIALLKWLVQWSSGPKAEIRLYDCNLFKTVLLVIYITNFYHQKFPLFILSKDEILVKKTPTSLHEKKTVWRQWTLILIFSVDFHMGLVLTPSLPVHMRPPEPDHPAPSVWTS